MLIRNQLRSPNHVVECMFVPKNNMKQIPAINLPCGEDPCDAGANSPLPPLSEGSSGASPFKRRARSESQSTNTSSDPESPPRPHKRVHSKGAESCRAPVRVLNLTDGRPLALVSGIVLADLHALKKFISVNKLSSTDQAGLMLERRRMKSRVYSARLRMRRCAAGLTTSGATKVEDDASGIPPMMADVGSNVACVLPAVLDRLIAHHFAAVPTPVLTEFVSNIMDNLPVDVHTTCPAPGCKDLANPPAFTMQSNAMHEDELALCSAWSETSM